MDKYEEALERAKAELNVDITVRNYEDYQKNNCADGRYLRRTDN